MGRTDRRARRRRSAVALALAAVALLAGCGNSRTAVPSLYRPAAPERGFPRTGALVYADPSAGFRVLVPANWTDLATEARAPVVMFAGSGAAIIAVSRYRRSLPPPTGPAGLRDARRTLLDAIRARDASFRLLSARTLTLGGRPAVQVRGIERISGQLRQVISSHVYLPRSELVLEEYAPPSQFDRVDRQVFSRVTGSFELLPAMHR